MASSSSPEAGPSATKKMRLTLNSSDVAESSTTQKKFLILKSSNGDKFELEESICMQSVTLKNMVEEGCTFSVIPLQTIDTETLIKVIEYMKMHAASNKEDDKIKNDYDKEFVKTYIQILFNYYLAANFLDIKSLIELCSQSIADRIKNKTPEAVRTIFNITNDFTPEEEAKVRNEAAWAFEGELDDSVN